MKKSEVQTPPSIRMRQWLTAVLILDTLLIFYTTLYPFDIFFTSPQTLTGIIAHFDFFIDGYNYVDDIPRNILLFVPFGFGFGGILAYTIKRKSIVFILTILAGALLSFVVETLQIYVLYRHSTFVDVFVNSLGAGFGFLLYAGFADRFDIWVAQIGYKVRPLLTIRYVTFLLFLYIALFTGISILVQKQTQLSDWDVTYPLMLGNESTGNRPWQGAMSKMYMLDRALTEEEVGRLLMGTSARQIGPENLVAFYDFLGNSSGNFPRLQWQGTPAFAEESSGIFLSQRQWLKSESAASSVSQSIRDSSQFTLGTRIAPGQFDKGGPRRIVSLSQGIDLRNITLGQYKRDLILRLRMPFSSQNGRFPEFTIPNVFLDDAYHEFVITYDGRQLHIYIDSLTQHYTIQLSPALAFFDLVPATEFKQMRITALNARVFPVLYIALVFVPFAAWLIFIYGRLSWQKWTKSVFVIGLLLIGSFAWEGVLGFFLNDYTITLENVWLNFAIGLLALLFFALWRAAWAYSAKQV